nr:uncharacterized protein LOC125421279 [Ziziphus jujuba var. spinosa]
MAASLVVAKVTEAKGELRTRSTTRSSLLLLLVMAVRARLLLLNRRRRGTRIGFMSPTLRNRSTSTSIFQRGSTHKNIEDMLGVKIIFPSSQEDDSIGSQKPKS